MTDDKTEDVIDCRLHYIDQVLAKMERLRMSDSPSPDEFWRFRDLPERAHEETECYVIAAARGVSDEMERILDLITGDDADAYAEAVAQGEIQRDIEALCRVRDEMCWLYRMLRKTQRYRSAEVVLADLDAQGRDFMIAIPTPDTIYDEHLWRTALGEPEAWWLRFVAPPPLKRD